MTSYRTVIGAVFPELVLDSDNNPVYVNGKRVYQNSMKYLPIDYQDDRSISANSKIVTQPLQNGSTMADHMYRDPVTVTIKGKFSLNGRNWNNDSYNFLSNSSDRLTSIQWIFEYIKNSGTLCTLTTVATDMDSADYARYIQKNNETTLYSNMTPSKTRFLVRENMALTSINWTEKQNTLEFSFGFTEVIMIDDNEYEVVLEDADLPSLRTPQANSIGTLLFSTGELPTYIIQTLLENGYMENEFLQWVSERWENLGVLGITVTAIGIGLGIVTGITLAASAKVAAVSVGIIAKSSVLIFPVGTIIAGVAVVAAGLFFGIKAIIKNNEENEKKKLAFTAANAETDCLRLQNLIDDVETALNSCGANLKIYTLSDDDQSICMAIGGNYYYLTFTKMNEEPYWNVDIRVNSDDENGSNITNRKGGFPVVTNYNELNENVNMWFKDETKQYEVYLVNPSLSDEANRTDEEKKVLKQTLSSYTIWVSQGHIRQSTSKINSAIENAIIEHDFNIETKED